MKKIILPPLFIFVTFTFFFHKLFFQVKPANFSLTITPKVGIYATPDYGRSEIWSLNYPLKSLLSDSLKKSKLPFWNKQVGTGYPVFAEGQIGALFLPNLVLYYLLPTPIAFNLSYIIAFGILFVGSFCFFLKNFKSWKLGLIGASIFSFNGFLLTKIPHLNLLQAVSLMPWIFLMVLALSKKPRPFTFLLLSLLLSQQFFTGHPQTVFITIFGMFFTLIFFSEEFQPDQLLKNIILLTGSLLFAIFLSSPQLLPSLELYMNSVRSDTSLAELAKFPLKLQHFLTMVLPDHFGTPKNGSYPKFDKGFGIYWENTFYVGFLPTAFTFFSLVLIKKIKAVLYLWLFVFFSVILSLGVGGPLPFLFTLPVMGVFRVPSRFLVLALFAMTGLALHFLTSVFSILKRLQMPDVILNIFYLLILLGVTFPLLKYAVDYNPVIYSDDLLKRPTVLDIIPEGQRVFTQSDVFGSWNDVLLKDGWKNPNLFLYFNNSLVPYQNLLFNRDSVLAEVSVPLKRQLALLKYPFIELLRSSGVNFSISTAPYGKLGNFSLIKEIKPPNTEMPSYFIYKLKDTLPRFRFAAHHEVRKFSYPEPNIKFKNSDYSFSDSVLLEENLEFEDIDSLYGNIKVIKDTHDELGLITETNGPAILVVADTYYPGWEAKVNGKKVKIFAANVNQRAILVSGGKNVVTFSYFPKMFWYGVIISVVSLYFFYKIMKKAKYNFTSQ